MIVRVNDRGPYHGGRVMDVSQRVAEALSFKGEGTARIRVDYIGRASLSGSDDEKLIATLRDDGGPAQLAEASSAIDVSQPLPSRPAPRSPLPRQPVLAAARLSHVSLSDPPPLFTPAIRASTAAADPARPRPHPLSTGQIGRLVRSRRRTPNGRPVLGSDALASFDSCASLDRKAALATARPLFADPKKGDDAAEAH